ncbi:MAG: hypothetical protein AUH85_11480 [Chloroflexi bacterium 13_1_40CM_4_68_4]|nr:MAG: hypothetical protein AUH85_11480 [Chloroflexi bacterium 13_1_40CM_4_68_4]
MERRDDPLRRYLDLLVTTLDEGLSGDEIARRAFLSRYHFDRVVSAALGEPPASLRRRLLLERAAYRLVNSGMDATAVALDAGYESPAAFTRAFRRAFGRPPTAFRSDHERAYWLAAPNGIHFHPPGSLLLSPSPRRDNTMDLTERLVEHDLWLTDELLRRASGLSDDALDRRLDLGDVDVEEISDATARDILEHLVFNKETWTASLTGREAPKREDHTVAGLRRRLAEVADDFRGVVRDLRTRGNWDSAFIDAQCDPPETFTYGDAIAHVITFSAHRRALAIGALRTLGVTDLPYGDPLDWERRRAGGA